MNDKSQHKRDRGRPLKDGAMRNRLHILLSNDDEEKLNHLTIETDMTKSEIIRKALAHYYNLTMRRF